MYHAASRTAETLISSRIDTDTEAGIDRQRRHRHGRTWKYWLGGLQTQAQAQTQIGTDVNTKEGAGTEADTETDIHKNADTATNISPQTQIKTQTNRYKYRHTHADRHNHRHSPYFTCRPGRKAGLAPPRVFARQLYIPARRRRRCLPPTILIE